MWLWACSTKTELGCCSEEALHRLEDRKINLGSQYYMVCYPQNASLCPGKNEAEFKAFLILSWERERLERLRSTGSTVRVRNQPRIHHFMDI